MYFPYIIFLLISSVNSKINVRRPSFQDITNSTIIPSPTPVEIQPIVQQQDPIVDQTPSDEIQQDSSDEIQQDPVVNTTDIIIYPAPSSIDPEISKQLTHIYNISVGTFVILFLILIIVFGVICKMCYNRY